MKPGLLKSIHWTAAIPIAVGVAVYSYWYFGSPQVLLSQEQSQLFLWDMTYLHDRLEMPGGWGDYLWSAVAQFFCTPILGALTMALLCMALQLVSMWLLHRLLKKPSEQDHAAVMPECCAHRLMEDGAPETARYAELSDEPEGGVIKPRFGLYDELYLYDAWSGGDVTTCCL